MNYLIKLFGLPDGVSQSSIYINFYSFTVHLYIDYIYIIEINSASQIEYVPIISVSSHDWIAN